MNEKWFKRCKILMIFFNCLFLLSGLALLGVGLWIVIDLGSFVAVLNYNSLLFVYSSYIAIVVGGITVIISFCGCFGAWKESKVLLIAFDVVLILFLVAEIIALILAFIYTSDLTILLNNAALESIKSSYGVTSTLGFAVTQAWDFTQTSAGCCGFNNGTDYAGSVFDAVSTTTQPWPLTCCLRNNAGGYVDGNACLTSSTISNINSNALLGCNEVLRTQISNYSTAIGGLAGGVIAIQLLAVIFATCVASNINKHRRISSFY